jgi:SAM-dependent methyltransferase
MGRSDETKLADFYTQPELWNLERFAANPDHCRRARVIASLIDPGVERVLDVGCANGFITRQLRATKLVVGMDPSFQALVNFKGPSIVGGGENIPFADATFDAVVCTEVLEHLPPDVLTRVVSELRRVAGRSLVIGVPYREDLWAKTIRCESCGEAYHVDLHYRSFRGPDDILALFPEFDREAVVFLNERLEIRSGLFRRFQYWLTGMKDGAEFAMCPRCGARPAREEGVGRRRSGFLNWLFEGLEWRMPKRRVPHWMIMSLRRR